MILYTVTFFSCPMRNARSVAWFSTAGFHQRSRWMTMDAAVRFKPVPPAFRLRIIARGPSGCWKRSTIASRADLPTPPWRNGTSSPRRSDK